MTKEIFNALLMLITVARELHEPRFDKPAQIVAEWLAASSIRAAFCKTKNINA
jgi:hypothetical protein